MNNAQETKIIYLIAGEPSGDFLGAQLMAAMKRATTQPIVFHGVGGPKMKAQGLNSLFNYENLAHMGLLEIIPHAIQIMAHIDQTVEDIEAKKPDALITIDAPGFCKRVVKKLRKKQFDTKYIHYIAPSVWAWRPKRAEIFAKLFDHLLALLPFEPPYFTRTGLACSFVGHPIVAETQTGNAESFRKRYDIAEHTPLFCVLPGSRRGEIKRHMPIFARAITLLSEQFPNLVIVVPVPKYLLEEVKGYFKGCPFRAVITADDDDKKNALKASQLALVKSGTVTLEVAMAGIPMVVAYRVNPLSAFIFRRLRLTKLVTLVNIIAGKEIIPELLQECATPLMIAGAAASLLSSPDRMSTQKQAMKEALSQLSPPVMLPSDKAASVVFSVLS